jgi:hypothetical protein
MLCCYVFVFHLDDLVMTDLYWCRANNYMSEHCCQIEAEFMAVTETACCRRLRDEWRNYRDRILQLATSAALKNADLHNMLSDLDTQDEGNKSASAVLLIE